MLQINWKFSRLFFICILLNINSSNDNCKYGFCIAVCFAKDCFTMDHKPSIVFVWTFVSLFTNQSKWFTILWHVFSSVSTADNFRRFMYVLFLNNRRLSNFKDHESISDAVKQIHGPTGEPLSLKDIRKVKLDTSWLIPRNLDWKFFVSLVCVWMVCVFF